MQPSPDEIEQLHDDAAAISPSGNDYLGNVMFDVNSAGISLDLPLEFGLPHAPNENFAGGNASEGSVNNLGAKPDSAVTVNEEIALTNSAEPSPKRARWAASTFGDQGKDPAENQQSYNNNEDADARGSESSGGHGAAGGGTSRTTSKTSPGSSGSQLEIKKMTDIKSRACDECRRRKTACYYFNSENSKCFRCQMENIDCTFSSRPRTTSHGGGPGSGGRQAPIPQRLAVKQQNSNSVAGPIEDYSQLPGRSLLKKTLSLQHPRSSFAVGQHGLWDQRVLESIVLDKANQARVAPNLALRKVGPDSWFMIRNEAGQNERAQDCDEIERLVYPYGRSLVNTFFMFFQPEYPILHEKIYVEKYMRTYRELLPALLGAVYLLGMRWWTHSPELSTVARPDHIMAPLYDLTLTKFFKSSGGSSLSLIQAGLLLLQCSYSDTRHLSICSVINAAAYRLALNRNCLQWKLPRWEINLRMRLSWAIYSQSTWISLFESIPPLIQDSSWYLSSLNPDMFDNGSNELSHNGALFIQLNKLSLIVHDMHNLLSSKLFMMYSSELSVRQATANNANVNMMTPTSLSDNIPEPMAGGYAAASAYAAPGSSPEPGVDSPTAGGTAPKISAETILELIKPIQLRLHDWYSKLQPALANIEGNPPSGSFSLRISYIAAEVTLHRFIIRAVCSGSLPISLDPSILKLLRSSARERLDVAYDLLQQLRPQHLQQFWYFPASYQLAVIGVFAALMYTTSQSKEEAEYYWTLLRNYINTIQLYSDNEVMSTALRTLRSSIAGVPGLVV